MKKQVILSVIVFVMAMLIVVVPTTAQACQSVVTSRGNLTATLVANGTVISGSVDGTGCDIAIYVPAAGSSTTIINANVHDANKYGVFADGASNVAIANSAVYNIGNHTGGIFAPNGVQTGLAIYFRNGATGSVSNSTIYNYQKNGITASGAGVSVSILNNTVTGFGRIDFIAQNGIQVSYGATAIVSGNTISGHYWTGCSHQDAAKTGCTPWVSTGILLYDVVPSAVRTSRNHFRENQFNFYMYPTTP